MQPSAAKDSYEPSPELVERAKKDHFKFREETAEALYVAGFNGASFQVKRGTWPAGIWGTLCAWSRGPDSHEKKTHAIARDYLGAYAASLGLTFVWSDEVEDHVEAYIEGDEPRPCDVSPDGYELRQPNVVEPRVANLRTAFDAYALLRKMGQQALHLRVFRSDNGTEVPPVDFVKGSRYTHGEQRS